jgi:hypothetical protein
MGVFMTATTIFEKCVELFSSSEMSNSRMIRDDYLTDIYMPYEVSSRNVLRLVSIQSQLVIN